MPIEIPTFAELFRLAPVITLVIIIVAVGFYVGWWSRGEVIRVLKAWLDDLRNRK